MKDEGGKGEGEGSKVDDELELSVKREKAADENAD